MTLAELTGMSPGESGNTEQRERERQVWRGDGWPEGGMGKKESSFENGGELFQAVDQILANAQSDIKQPVFNVKRKKKRKLNSY
jgi:hypothetical protein